MVYSFNFKAYPTSSLELISIFFILLLYACNDVKKTDSKTINKDTVLANIEITAANLAGNFSSQSELKLDRTAMDSFFIKYLALSPFKDKILRFYTGRDFAFAWYDINGPIEQAGSLYNRIQNLEEEGVNAEVPYLSLVDSMMTNQDTRDQNLQSEAEILLTAYYFYFAEKIWGGLDGKKTRQIDWLLPRKEINYEGWLDSLLQMPSGFSGVNEPVYRQYNLLKAFLKKYRDLDKTYQWQALSTDKKSYRLGDSANILVELKKRLFLLGDLNTSSESQLFDSTLVHAVKKFQSRFGVKQDGIIGQQVIRELSESLQKRIGQISVNIERSRWLPDEIKGEYLAVNIPDFKLYAYKGDSLLWDMNVVVGKSVHKTVIFSGDLKYVVLSPYWNVPSSILKNEILPGIRKNKNYLASHHMEWNGKSVRQKPGPWNSLGQVKFLFPNSFSIYLHDTPSKSLFAEDKRAFSHGCIRVAEPQKLAIYLLRKDPNWNERKITQAMNSGNEQYVTLKETIPVFITYFTAFVDRKGNLNFRDDIYGRDSRLAEMFNK